MSEYRLVMKGVVKTFPGVKALDHAQLELRPGKVMALMGENGAGKSTLMKCMFGIYKMDEGEIEYEGEKVVIANPLEALGRGIAMVHQELQPIPARTVAENIWLGRYPTKKIGPITIVDHSKMYADTDALLKKLKLQINSHAKLGSLSIAQMQMVEIAKAVSANCKVLILDEPTSSLTANEVESLFRIMRELKALGVALVYISHKMDEIKVIADEVTIMRDGHYIGKWDVANMTKEQIMADLQAGTADAADMGEIPALSSEEMEQLFDIISDKNRIVGVEPGKEVVLTYDIGQLDFTGDNGNSGNGVDMGRLEAALLHERALGADTFELAHADYSIKPVKPIIANEMQTMEEIQNEIIAPYFYGAMPNMGLYYAPDGPYGNPADLMREFKMEESMASSEAAAEHLARDIEYVSTLSLIHI